MSKVPDIVYPKTWERPGPAAQQEAMLELMEDWLNDNVDSYDSHQVFDGGANLRGESAEEWVEFRRLYSRIHWMYLQLVGEEGDSEADSQKKEAH